MARPRGGAGALQGRRRRCNFGSRDRPDTEPGWGALRKPPRSPEAEPSRWGTLLPLLLVVVSLAGLVVVPWVIQRRARALQGEIIEITSPARALVSRIQYELAMEFAATRGFLLSGRESYVESYEAARRERTRDLERLQALALELGPRAHARVLALSEELDRSDELIDSLYAGRIDRSEYLARLSEQQSLFEVGLKRAAALDASFSEEGHSRSREAERLTRTSVWVETGLVALALTAALLVALLGARQRALVRRLARHSRRETALKEAARALGEATSVAQAVESIAKGAIRSTHAMGAYVERAELPIQGTDVVVVASAGEGSPPIGTRAPYPGSLTQEIIASGEPKLLTEVGAIGEQVAPYLRESCGGCSGLIVPLSTAARALGALVMLRAGTEEHFDRDDAVAARSLGDLASAALRRVMLLEQLSESERRFRLVTDHLKQVIWLGTPGLGARYFVNPACEPILGLSREEFLADPKAVIEMAHPDDRARILEAMRDLPVKPYDERFRIVRRDGRVRWIWSRIYPIRSEAGEASLVAGILEDVTEAKEAEEERERLMEREREALAQSEEARAEAVRRRDEVERVTRSRARLIRGFGHDVKNPLGAADGFLQLMERNTRDPPSPGQRERLAKARRSLRAALELIESLLALARAQSGTIELEQAAVDLREVAARSAEEYRAQAEAAGLELRLTLPDAPIVIESDGRRIGQILGNLLSNAVKYTDRGWVEVGVTPREEGRVSVYVSDTGSGLSPEDRSTIFEEFHRVEGTAGQRGAGIGLTISQAVARALGGEIVVESELGKGSTFTLWLPAPRPLV